MFSRLSVSLALVAVLPSLVSAIFPAAESYAACLDAAPTGLPVLVPIADATGGCSTYCANMNWRYAYLSPGSTQCGCSNVGPTAAEYSTATDAFMGCTAAQWDVRIPLTTFGVPTCYSGYTTTSDPTLRLGPTTVADHSQCFRFCLNYDAATLVPSTSGTGYSCTCDRDAGDVASADQATCAKGVLARYAGHSAGQTVDGTGAPGPSTFVKRQQREQLRLAAEKEQKLCPDEGKACLVAQGKESWECMDTQSDLESCGGCMNGEFGVLSGTSSVGVDCTALPGVSMGGVTCTHGQCAIWACDPGFKLSGRECVPVKNVKRALDRQE